MPVFSEGGGGGRAGTGAPTNQFAFDQPYEINGQFTAETAQQINDMFRILFKSLKRGETRVEAVDDRIDGLTRSAWTTIQKTVEQENGGTTTYTADTTLVVPIQVGYSTHIRFGCQLWSSGDGVSGGMKIRLNHTATAAVFSSLTSGGITTLGSDQFSTSVPTGGPSAQTNSGGQPGIFEGWVAIDNVTVAGDFKIEYASLGGGVGYAARMRRGSWVEYFRVAN